MLQGGLLKNSVEFKSTAYTPVQLSYKLQGNSNFLTLLQAKEMEISLRNYEILEIEDKQQSIHVIERLGPRN